MSPTYDFILSLARNYARPPARLLDFGCGEGQLVDLASNAGFDAFGVDSFEGVWQQFAASAGEKGARIQRIVPGEALGFEDGAFDIVVSNQVFEHVRDLSPVVAELARVLRPNGTLIAVFPTREVVIEPHLKAPFVHWFSQGSATQRAALGLSHAVGLCNRPRMKRSDWVAEELGNLRDHMFYRTVPACLEVFRSHFDLKSRQEAAFLRHRLAVHPMLANAARLPAAFDPLFAMAALRLANAVFVFQRRA